MSGFFIQTIAFTSDHSFCSVSKPSEYQAHKIYIMLNIFFGCKFALTYANDTSTSVSADDEKEVIRRLEIDAKNVLKFMPSNGLLANASKTAFIFPNKNKLYQGRRNKKIYICYSSVKYKSISLNCSTKIIKSAPKHKR